ncbi:MAG TPA: hypothetical protein VKV03_14365 [Candidatus Binataceae bacterium]|nr:hypothetical protein [Candidatus Binataceae bacterium]
MAVTMALAVAAAGRIWAASSPEPTQKIGVRVDSVLASDTHQGVDTQLTPMGPRLQSLFNYTSYRLVSHQERQTPMGTQISFDLPGGRILHVEPSAIEGDMIEMELVLFQGERPVMTTDLKLRNHGVLIVGGPRYEQGMLIISIGADCRCPHSRTADAGTPRE